MIEAMRDDLAKIKGDAEAVNMCLTNVPESPGTVSHLRTQLEEMKEELLKSQQLLSLKTKGILICLKGENSMFCDISLIIILFSEFEAMCVQAQESNDQLLQANRVI